jgi:hypothetical protein
MIIPTSMGNTDRSSLAYRGVRLALVAPIAVKRSLIEPARRALRTHRACRRR